MTHALRADVVVIGGGPAGAATAWALARNGADVLLFERGGTVPSAPAEVSAKASDTLAEMGLLGAVAPHGHRAGAFAAQRDVVDRATLAAASAAGGRVSRGMVAEAPEPNANGGARVRATGAHGLQAVDARLVIVADGARTTIAGRGGPGRVVSRSTIALVGDAAQAVDPHACDALHAALHGGITLAGYAFEALRLPAGRAHEPLEAYARWRRHAFGRSGRLSRIANVFLRPEPVR